MDSLAELAKALIVPPASLFLMSIVGWLLLRRRPRLGRWLLALGGVPLVALSLPVVGYNLYGSLNDYPALDVAQATQSAGAIVILGGETSWASEEGGNIPGPESLQRLRYGARLQKRLHLPILVTGGPAMGRQAPIAELMAKVMADDYGAAVRWQEGKSRNTYENALFSAEILRRNGIGTIYLVTNAAHMARAKATFEALNIAVIPAPVGVPPWYPETAFGDFLPSAHALGTSAAAIYEYLARVWYSILDRSAYCRHLDAATSLPLGSKVLATMAAPSPFLTNDI